MHSIAFAKKSLGPGALAGFMSKTPPPRGADNPKQNSVFRLQSDDTTPIACKGLEQKSQRPSHQTSENAVLHRPDFTRKGNLPVCPMKQRHTAYQQIDETREMDSETFACSPEHVPSVLVPRNQPCQLQLWESFKARMLFPTIPRQCIGPLGELGFSNDADLLTNS